ncbi:hypothetical protein SULI_04670 [Saccharolobus solfataricus]|uniref:Uncharacterized protein n=3 Tax=Saccharolobus solfataricus TaxID=2287 RepID=Q97U45_SACS2|nr:hypothetical protein [Saccharolobus solfataricus]AAK43277.1 Hypothetical protein SSO3179 [Saccharolobus solfataricus P2]AKA73301.1 hypothetical protein SULB_0954 [Saccharolobus solfataricus]AKA76000.1 hypothetical protein SULC_0953 [Saccharolobus solfataricus]AKA78693.1 hypothetical protein SULA_0952 [Saccharolobus solfataricus]AZF67768.1 hypothetical protein SULG_04670 [Saccharolobus solfataricus]
MPIKGKRKYKVEFDDYTLTSVNGEISLINELGSKVDFSKLEIGDFLANKINSDRYFYYKIIPLSKYSDIVTYSLIDSIVKVGGFYGDLLEACYLKDSKSGSADYNYLKYAFDKISILNIKIYDTISDEAVKKLIDIYGWDFIKIYENLRSLFRVSAEKAYNKVIEKLDSRKELDAFMVYIIYSYNKNKAKEILEKTVITPNLDYDYEYIIPRWGLVGIDDNIIKMFNEVGVNVHKDSLRFNEIKILLTKINNEKVKLIS